MPVPRPRPPAPACPHPGCTTVLEWSTRSRRYPKWCERHRSAASRGVCGKGIHPKPQPGTRCSLCSNEAQGQRRQAERVAQRGPEPQLVRRPRPVEAVPGSAGRGPGGVWRPAGLIGAKGGPDDPRWSASGPDEAAS